MPQSPPTRILLVDDQPLFRGALASLISGQKDMLVVGEAGNGAEALLQVRALAPDLVVMDVQMPVANGVDGVRLIRGAGLSTRIVMLTVSEEDDDLFAAIAAGANGYLLKDIHPDQFFEMLRAAARGQAPVSPAVAYRLLEAFRAPRTLEASARRGSAESELSPRQADVLGLVAEGLSNKEIAARLGITEGTVKNHVHNALEKLHARSRTEAASLMARQEPRPRESAEPPGAASRSR